MRYTVTIHWSWLLGHGFNPRTAVEDLVRRFKFKARLTSAAYSRKNKLGESTGKVVVDVHFIDAAHDLFRALFNMPGCLSLSFSIKQTDLGGVQKPAATLAEALANERPAWWAVDGV